MKDFLCKVSRVLDKIVAKMNPGDRLRLDDFAFVLHKEFPNVSRPTLRKAAEVYVYTNDSLVTKRGSVGGVYKDFFPETESKDPKPALPKKKRFRPLKLVNQLIK